MRKGRMEVLVAVVAAMASAQAPHAAAAGPLQKGVSLTLWDEDVNLTQLSSSLTNMAAAGVGHVAVNVWWFQQNINSTTIAADFTRYSASDDSVRAVIDAVHAAGMQVLLKPLVDLSNDPTHWRGQIVGGSTWFTGSGGYADFVNHFAGIAQAKGAEMFCVGTELVATTSQETSWRNLITGVKASYAGEVTYAANHGGASAVTAAAINWWDAVDYFGLDAYYPLTSKLDPSLAELQAAWAAKAGQIETWRNGIDPAKPVLFTEVGYRSWEGANRAPYDGSNKGDTDVDEQEQADCYEALFSQLWETQEWLEGVYWWNWEVDPNPTWEADNWYTPQGKAAEVVIQKYYAPHPGDANRDAQVDVLDLAVMANHFKQTPATWREANFNPDDRVDVLDLAIMANHFGWSGGAEPVPGPTVLSLLALGGLALIRRRRKMAAPT